MAVTNILAPEMMPNLPIPICKSVAIDLNSGGNSPIMIWSKAASAIKTNIVNFIFRFDCFNRLKLLFLLTLK